MTKIVSFLIGAMIGIIGAFFLVKVPSSSTIWPTIDRLEPPLLSGAVALFVVWLTRRRELRKVSMDFYKEFYSKEIAESRYEAETFFDQHAGTDWSLTDPYEVNNDNNYLKGYAAVTRYWARLGVIYREGELDRTLIEKLMAYTAGYWWGAVYEQMTRRSSMYTRRDIIDLCEAIRKGEGSKSFCVGYDVGRARFKASS